MKIQVPAGGWKPRPAQLPLWSYMENGGKTAVAVWHRRYGKDELALRYASVAMVERPGTYWHMLPEATQARKAIWEAINPHTGKRRIDEAFPKELRKATRENEMFIRFCDSTWQVVGSDNFDSLVGSPPIGIVYSEWPLANPSAAAYLRPILAENDGWELFIYTPRGRNHGLTTYERAKKDPKAFAEKLTVDDTKAITPERLAEELAWYISEYGKEDGEAFYRQEYYCDFNAPLIGAILGRYVERAERDHRISEEVHFDPEGAPVEISSDIGFRDTSSWWFWQPKVNGYSLIDHDSDRGLDADDWIERIQAKGYPIGHIWLPKDAKAKTFQSKRSAMERFLHAFSSSIVRVVPADSIVNRINAARRIIAKCEFAESACAQGLDGLRAWCYEWDDELKVYGKDPKHDWASHHGDSFSYGAQVMELAEAKEPKKEDIPSGYTLNDLWKDHERQLSRIQRI